MKGQSTTPTMAKAENQSEPTPEILEQIRARAHELFEQRGREEGHDLDDWLQAEAEVTQQQQQTAKTKAA
jgi:Protein of unknown function (DUF2934)